MEKNLLVLVLLLFVSSGNATYPGNYALSFDGKDDIVTVPITYQDYALSDFWTLEAWIYPTAEQSYWQLNIVGFPGRHPNMNYCGQGNFQCPPGSPLVQLRASNGNWFPIVGNATRATPDQWHHIAGTWNNATLNLYLDGILDISVNPYTLGYTEAVPCYDRDCDLGFQIGGNYFKTGNGGVFSSQYFRGYIDEVRVWTVGRSQREIRAAMNIALTGYEPALLYYWRFDDHGGSVTKSSAFDIYALLGGGYLDAHPRFIPSSAPITAPPGTIPAAPGNPAPIIVEKNSAGAVTAGALIGIFCLLGGIVVGLIVGWKYGKQLLSYLGRGGDDGKGEGVPLIK